LSTTSGASRRCDLGRISASRPHLGRISAASRPHISAASRPHLAHISGASPQPAGYAVELPEDMLSETRERLKDVNARSIKKVRAGSV